MPILIVPFVLLAFLALIVLLIPLSLFMRYRAGTARRRARGWVAATNAISLGLSILIFFVFAAIGNAWIPHALSYSTVGALSGCLLGILGLRISQWETTPKGLFYTPNRWLVLGITVVVTLRIGFGFWRAWQAWRTTPDSESWLAASGLAGSMGVGALVIGYYACYWVGLWLRIRRQSR